MAAGGYSSNQQDQPLDIAPAHHRVNLHTFKMDTAIHTMVQIYKKNARGHENLGSQEFHKLVSGHLPNILTSSDCKEAVEQMKQQLDKNKDGKISFEEYMTLIGTLACMLSRQRMAQLEQD